MIREAFEAAMQKHWSWPKEAFVRHPEMPALYFRIETDHAHKGWQARDAEVAALEVERDRYKNMMDGYYHEAATAYEKLQKAEARIAGLEWLLNSDNSLYTKTLRLQDEILLLQRRSQKAEAERDRLRAELTNIANAQPHTKDDDWRADFQDWAQSRARDALKEREQ